jgi:hypothetical protein
VLTSRRHILRPVGLRWASGVGAALLAEALIAGTAPAALAAKRPQVRLTLPANANAGARIPYQFTEAHVARADRLVIERQEGTAHTYRIVSRLSHRHSGSGSLPALNLGRYKLRIADIRARKTYAAAPATLYVYGNVPLATLLGDQNGGTYTSPTQTFPYTDRLQANQVTGDTVLTVPGSSNHCRSINFDLIAEGGPYAYDSDGEPFTLTVVQQSLDPVSSSAQPNQVQQLNAQLIPGQSWSLRTSSATSSDSDHLDVNGSANCYSSAPAA